MLQEIKGVFIMPARTALELTDKIKRVQESVHKTDDLLYQGCMLSETFTPEDLTSHFTAMFKCLKDLTDKVELDIEWQNQEKALYDITRPEVIIVGDAIAGLLGNAIAEMCKATYVFAPVIDFEGCPKSVNDLVDADVILYGNATEGATVRYDGNLYRVVDEKIWTNPYFGIDHPSIKCFSLDRIG